MGAWSRPSKQETFTSYATKFRLFRRQTGPGLVPVLLFRFSGLVWPDKAEEMIDAGVEWARVERFSPNGKYAVDLI